MHEDPADFQALATENTRAWKSFLKLFFASLVAMSGAIYLLFLGVDPFDSGRLTNSPGIGIVADVPRYAAASLGRDATFNSAVIGNSHGQELDPTRLSNDRALSFIQLTVSATGPREQMAVLRWFVRHHQRIGAIVMVADAVWCTGDRSLPPISPFPFWLYDDNSAKYLLHVFQTPSLVRVWRRALLSLGVLTRTRRDGYSDYEQDPALQAREFRPNIPVGFRPAPPMVRAPEEPLPAVELLRTALADIDADVPLIVVIPPMFFSALPAAGSADADHLAQCKGALFELVGERSRGAFLDFAVDDETARNPDNFFDLKHYRSPVARLMEARIASALEALETASDRKRAPTE